MNDNSNSIIVPALPLVSVGALVAICVAAFAGLLSEWAAWTASLAAVAPLLLARAVKPELVTVVIRDER